MREHHDRPERPDSFAVEIEDLRVEFATDGGDVVAVDRVSLRVRPGEILALVGESGSGKSVTARTLLGLLPEHAQASGSVRVGGEQVIGADRETLRKVRGSKAAMVFQEPSTALNPVFTVGWQIAEGLRVHSGLSRREARAEAIEMLRKVGLPEPERRVDYYPHQLSGGQKQRVIIAAALVLNPAVIVADEPTTALDVTVQAEILDLLRRCRDEFGAAIVIITHNMGVVADLADTVAVMHDGVIVETAPVGQLFAAPQREYTRELLAAVPRIELAAAGSVPAASTAPIVAARGLEIVFPGGFGKPGFRAVDGVDFAIAPGEVVGLVGESGSGKTTIGRAIAGLTRATGGSLEVLGVDVVAKGGRRLGPHRRRFGFVFQDPAASFNPLRTIGKAMAEPIYVHGTAAERAGADQRVREMLEAVRLPATFAERFPHELSGGQRQRASLARALMLGPDLLIADEPTSALDVSVQAAVLDLFDELHDEFGFACLFITHDLAVVDRVADRVIVLHHGQVVESGPTDTVLGAPTQDYTRRLLASLPVPDPVEQAQRREALAAVGRVDD